ncbi:MAG: B12-binding domain-containing radical SAM protein, partial [Treponema sp.]|nr:B12-binding domain-containing radical SAM protein [Treponema sp.]
MIGLPLNFVNINEENQIVDFILEAGKAAGSHFNINLGTFVPKPHTPYQWDAQLNEEVAWQKLYYIKDKLKPKGHKVSIHSPFFSLLEGIFSRGTEKAGELALEAYSEGCRLDAWQEHIKIDIWKGILNNNLNIVNLITRNTVKTEKLPWSVIESGVGEKYLKNEKIKSNNNISTSVCMKLCTHKCEICSIKNKIVYNNRQYEVEIESKSYNGMITY